jgi:hypothetical protein
MKLKTLLFSVFALTCFFMQAQDWSTDVYKHGEEYPGYIIEEGGKKTEGFITYRDRYSMQNEVIFYATKGDKKSKVKYKTDDLTEYMVADKLYKCIHYSGGLMKKPIKANLLVTDGCIAEFVWYERAEGYMTMQQLTGESYEDYMKRMYPRTTVYLKAGDEEPRTTDNFALKFASKMSEWISDDAVLSQKVADKEKGYGMLAILDIIAQYNENCAN